jgi:DNA-binding NarL/FixJ family response regulator
MTRGEPAPPGRTYSWPGGREDLKEREAEILALITQGSSNAEIAARVHLSENTVKSYVHQLYRKIGVTSRTQAVLWGTRHGFSPHPDRTDHARRSP